MIKLVDVKQHLLNAIMDRRRYLAIFIISTILVLTLDAVLMATSKDSYVLELVFTIILTVIYFVFLIFYFSVLRKRIMSELNFYSAASEGELNTVHVELIEFNEETKINNGIEYYVLKALTLKELKDDECYFYAPKRFEFKKNQKATLKTFGSVIIEVEEEK